QLWGNPTYKWDVMEKQNFKWWIDRLKNLLSMFDSVRIDHFRGLIAYWAVPYGEVTAQKGKWIDVPYEKFFACLKENFPTMPFWAENLGIITPDVEELRKKMELPGMLVLHFAFGNPADNPYAPHNHTRDSVVYTGTHDNNTSRGWFENDATNDEIKNFSSYVGLDIIDGYIFTSEVTRLALSSVADIAIVPMQDYLKLGADARTNTPSTPTGNWAWKMQDDELPDGLADRMKAACSLYGRI
ncbi:MAG: 4-alpha-glucanotransferase, partial [Synergistaceae bacterium]|nr:4-alpha-glucanotransferase [Synergistaceae bacterium]